MLHFRCQCLSRLCVCVCVCLQLCLEYVTLLEYSMNSTINLNLWGCFQPHTEQRIAGRLLLMAVKKSTTNATNKYFNHVPWCIPSTISYLANYTLSSRPFGINNATERANQYKVMHGCNQSEAFSTRTLTHSS